MPGRFLEVLLAIELEEVVAASVMEHEIIAPLLEVLQLELSFVGDLMMLKVLATQACSFRFGASSCTFRTACSAGSVRDFGSPYVATDNAPPVEIFVAPFWHHV